MKKISKLLGVGFVLAGLLALMVACSSGEETNTAGTGGTGTSNTSTTKLSGAVNIDGSSTVYPVQEAIAEEYRHVQPDVRVTVGVSGTGGGFKRFTVGETDISNASRPIKSEEAEIAKANGIEHIELPVAFDGLAVVVSSLNDFIKDLSVEELQKIWTGQVTKWNQVRPSFPDEAIKLYGPGTDSGTFDYWNEVIIQKGNTITSNFVASEDDNLLVRGVAADKYGLAYFGYAYYEENKDKLNLVAISEKTGGPAVLPTEETINNGTYAPLSRPIFVYVNKKSFLEKPQVADYVYFMNRMAGELSLEVGYINLQQSTYDENKAKLDELKK
jgi:phosphate transport system substrate-binding protein